MSSKMIQKTKKPTLKELIRVITMLTMKIEQLELHVFKGDQALDEYIKMKDDKDDFIEYLQKKAEPNDKDTEKAEDK
jgi:hypothetical protein